MIALTLFAVGVAMMLGAARRSACMRKMQRASQIRAEHDVAARRAGVGVHGGGESLPDPLRDGSAIVLHLTREQAEILRDALAAQRKANLAAGQLIRAEAQRRFYGRERRFSDDDFAALLREANHDDLDWRE